MPMFPKKFIQASKLEKKLLDSVGYVISRNSQKQLY